MTAIEKERLAFHTDLTEAEQVYDFPKQFARFLIEHDRQEDAEEFLDAVNHYLHRTDEHEAALATILNLGSYYADIEDHSGVPFEWNELFFHDGGEMTAEEVLQSLEHSSDEPDEINDVGPEHPDIAIAVDDIVTMVYDAIVALRLADYKKSADQLARESRQLTRDKPTVVDYVRLLRTYVEISSSE